MIDTCDSSPEDKNFLKICRELMQLQQPPPYLDQRRTGAKTAGGVVKTGGGRRKNVSVNDEPLEWKEKWTQWFKAEQKSLILIRSNGSTVNMSEDPCIEQNWPRFVFDVTSKNTSVWCFIKGISALALILTSDKHVHHCRAVVLW